MENNTKQIVFIGGGYASIWAYRSVVEELLIEMMMGRVRIQVICPEEFHFFHGWTAESLTGIIQDQNRMSPLAEIFKHAEIIKGKAVHIDTVSRVVQVNMNNGTHLTVTYDHLFMGMGSTDDSSIDGLSDYAYQLKSHTGYLRCKMRIQFLIRQAAGADAVAAQKLLRFTIAGAGFTGVEIAANLAEMLQAAKKQFPTLRKIKPTIQLINSREFLLPGLQNSLQRIRKYTEKILRLYGIEILNRVRICRVSSQGVHLSDGSFIESRMVISTIGQCRNLINGTQNMERDGEKRIITDSFLRIKDHQDIWGAGDTVRVNHAKTNKACTSNALWAIKQGGHAGKNIARAILSQSLKPFTYKGLGQCASLGIGKGMGEIYGIPFTGWPAWIMRWLFFQHFMPSKKIMWREISDWFRLLMNRKRNQIKGIPEEMNPIFVPDRMKSGNFNQLVYQN
jgi:NADH dehydrogenase